MAKETIISQKVFKALIVVIEHQPKQSGAPQKEQLVRIRHGTRGLGRGETSDPDSKGHLRERSQVARCGGDQETVTNRRALA
jgi:hypothetical protein